MSLPEAATAALSQWNQNSSSILTSLRNLPQPTREQVVDVFNEEDTTNLFYAYLQPPLRLLGAGDDDPNHPWGKDPGAPDLAAGAHQHEGYVNDEDVDHPFHDTLMSHGFKYKGSAKSGKLHFYTHDSGAGAAPGLGHGYGVTLTKDRGKHSWYHSSDMMRSGKDVDSLHKHLQWAAKLHNHESVESVNEATESPLYSHGWKRQSYGPVGHTTFTHAAHPTHLITVHGREWTHAEANGVDVTKGIGQGMGNKSLAAHLESFHGKKESFYTSTLPESVVRKHRVVLEALLPELATEAEFRTFQENPKGYFTGHGWTYITDTPNGTMFRHPRFHGNDIIINSKSGQWEHIARGTRVATGQSFDDFRKYAAPRFQMRMETTESIDEGVLPDAPVVHVLARYGYKHEKSNKAAQVYAKGESRLHVFNSGAGGWLHSKGSSIKHGAGAEQLQAHMSKIKESVEPVDEAKDNMQIAAASHGYKKDKTGRYKGVKYRTWKHPSGHKLHVYGSNWHHFAPGHDDPKNLSVPGRTHLAGPIATGVGSESMRAHLSSTHKHESINETSMDHIAQSLGYNRGPNQHGTKGAIDTWYHRQGHKIEHNYATREWSHTGKAVQMKKGRKHEFDLPPVKGKGEAALASHLDHFHQKGMWAREGVNEDWQYTRPIKYLPSKTDIFKPHVPARPELENVETAYGSILSQLTVLISTVPSQAEAATLKRLYTELAQVQRAIGDMRAELGNEGGMKEGGGAPFMAILASVRAAVGDGDDLVMHKQFESANEGRRKPFEMDPEIQAGLHRDFHTLPSHHVQKVVDMAIKAGYHKPKNANGSRGRYFYAHLQRKARKEALQARADRVVELMTNNPEYQGWEPIDRTDKPTPKVLGNEAPKLGEPSLTGFTDEDFLDETPNSNNHSHEDLLPAVKAHGYEYKGREDSGSVWSHKFTHKTTGKSLYLHSNKSGGGNAWVSHEGGGHANTPAKVHNLLSQHESVFELDTNNPDYQGWPQIDDTDKPDGAKVVGDDATELGAAILTGFESVDRPRFPVSPHLVLKDHGWHHVGTQGEHKTYFNFKHKDQKISVHTPTGEWTHHNEKEVRSGKSDGIMKIGAHHELHDYLNKKEKQWAPRKHESWQADLSEHIEVREGGFAGISPFTGKNLTGVLPTQEKALTRLRKLVSIMDRSRKSIEAADPVTRRLLHQSLGPEDQVVTNEARNTDLNFRHNDNDVSIYKVIGRGMDGGRVKGWHLSVNGKIVSDWHGTRKSALDAYHTHHANKKKESANESDGYKWDDAFATVGKHGYRGGSSGGNFQNSKTGHTITMEPHGTSWTHRKGSASTSGSGLDALDKHLGGKPQGEDVQIPNPVVHPDDDEDDTTIPTTPVAPGPPPPTVAGVATETRTQDHDTALRYGYTPVGDGKYTRPGHTLKLNDWGHWEHKNTKTNLLSSSKGNGTSLDYHLEKVHGKNKREDIQYEMSPPGFSGVVKKMKEKGMAADKAFALAWSMYKKGHKAHVAPEGFVKKNKGMQCSECRFRTFSTSEADKHRRTVHMRLAETVKQADLDFLKSFDHNFEGMGSQLFLLPIAKVHGYEPLALATSVGENIRYSFVKHSTRPKDYLQLELRRPTEEDRMLAPKAFGTVAGWVRYQNGFSNATRGFSIEELNRHLLLTTQPIAVGASKIQDDSTGVMTFDPVQSDADSATEIPQDDDRTDSDESIDEMSPYRFTNHTEILSHHGFKQIIPGGAANPIKTDNSVYKNKEKHFVVVNPHNGTWAHHAGERKVYGSRLPNLDHHMARHYGNPKFVEAVDESKAPDPDSRGYKAWAKAAAKGKHPDELSDEALAKRVDRNDLHPDHQAALKRARTVLKMHNDMKGSGFGMSGVDKARLTIHKHTLPEAAQPNMWGLKNQTAKKNHKLFAILAALHGNSGKYSLEAVKRLSYAEGARGTQETREEFATELRSLINKHSMENQSNTPDFLLSKHLMNCLDSFNAGVADREKWYGRNNAGPTSTSEDVTTKDFQFSGNYHVHVNGKRHPHAIFRDPASGSWHEDRPHKDAFDHAVIGFTKKEALTHIAKQHGVAYEDVSMATPVGGSALTSRQLVQQMNADGDDDQEGDTERHMHFRRGHSPHKRHLHWAFDGADESTFAQAVINGKWQPKNYASGVLPVIREYCDAHQLDFAKVMNHIVANESDVRDRIALELDTIRESTEYKGGYKGIVRELPEPPNSHPNHKGDVWIGRIPLIHGYRQHTAANEAGAPLKFSHRTTDHVLTISRSMSDEAAREGRGWKIEHRGRTLYHGRGVAEMHSALRKIHTPHTKEARDLIIPAKQHVDREKRLLARAKERKLRHVVGSKSTAESINEGYVLYEEHAPEDPSMAREHLKKHGWYEVPGTRSNNTQSSFHVHADAKYSEHHFKVHPNGSWEHHKGTADGGGKVHNFKLQGKGHSAAQLHHYLTGGAKKPEPPAAPHKAPEHPPANPHARFGPDGKPFVHKPRPLVQPKVKWTGPPPGWKLPQAHTPTQAPANAPRPPGGSRKGTPVPKKAEPVIDKYGDGPIARRIRAKLNMRRKREDAADSVSANPDDDDPGTGSSDPSIDQINKNLRDGTSDAINGKMDTVTPDKPLAPSRSGPNHKNAR